MGECLPANGVAADLRPVIHWGRSGIGRGEAMFYVGAFLVWLVDWLTKYWVSHSMELGQTIPVWPGVFHITYHENAGAAFSMLQNQRWLFVAVTLVVIAGILSAKRRTRRRSTRIALALLLGGAVGNLWDRLVIGRVIDFLDVRIIHFPIFNVADSCITIAVAWMVVDALLAGRTVHKEKES
ncbi:signal peptidase II [Kyrpidia spormannii]|uniref:Signal peptidase II n=3 Tax=Kyrpidia spormannii TaxID=2055160 RepID=A0ACA8Z9P9_9BACL|nr:signal peptidase II [Kyrpidia spormannii]CAB3393716.1 signal peptidase II [Kyrpidia spormannii]